MPRWLAVPTPASSAWRSASMNVTPWALAHTSRRPTVVSPTPRLGTFSTRFTLTSSAGFTTALR